MLPQVRVHVIDRRGDLFFAGVDTKEPDQVADGFFGVSDQFGELDAEERHVGMFGDEALAVLQQTALQLFALIVGCGEPLASMYFRS